ncbi:Dopey, N-terminal-domain-containing protein [Naematelia encephala]|uniref:Dopey, N-terminal-domain-containing protein n=1 Tax=Naematelia encephala TaxID=71784 RepID=A0A1Y2AUD0_9TREE|nr:Dopey, N-terminal-domain-containing protein [Naematelia encephala]
MAEPLLTPLSEAGPSSTPQSRAASPSRHALRRPASHGRLARLMVPGRSRSSSVASQKEANVTVYADEISNSGRTTPEQRRRTGKAAAASLLASDAKYKKFAAQVDRCLQSFESVNEWADFISFLSRLLKTLQTPSPAYSEIPRKLVVAKRLAQCLNPALPSGVHQRALDVYAYIFSMIGAEGLKRDLLIWSSGLFPFFQFAATSVRPILISIYDAYYLPLGEDLRPATKALMLALLPGMEEETGDFFDKILALLSRLCDAVSAPFFYQNMFLVLISTPSTRLAALNFLARKLPKPPESGIDHGMMIRGVAAVLEDENALVRRSGLDMLLRLLRLDGEIMRGADEKDRDLLFRATTDVVLQRDLSLSRRVYTWLLGSDETSEQQIVYLQQNALSDLVRCLEADMRSTDLPDRQKPFKIFLALLDKWEIGRVLSDHLAIPALRAIKASLEDSTNESRDELLTTASAVYEAIEPLVIWRAFYDHVSESQYTDLMSWTLAAIPQHDEEIVDGFLPVLLQRILRMEASQIPVELASLLLRAIPASSFAKSPNAEDEEDEVASLIYTKGQVTTETISRVQVEVLPQIVKSIFKISEIMLQSRTLPYTVVEILHMVSSLIDLEAAALGAINLQQWTNIALEGLSKMSSFASIDAVVSAILKASRCPIIKPSLDVSQDNIIEPILDALFRYLRPEAAPYHVRAVELLWDYNQLAEIHTLENVIARRMSARIGKAEAFDAFGVLWKLTHDSMLPGEIFNVPVFTLIDALGSSDPDLQRTAETWMRCNLKSYFRVLDPILSRLLEQHVFDDLNYTRYLLDSIATLFRFGGQGLSKSCQSTEVSKSAHSTFVERAASFSQSHSVYLDLLVGLLIKSLSISRPSGMLGLTTRVQASALEVLQILVSRGDISFSSLEQLKAALLVKLDIAIQARHLTLQSKMLHLFHSAIGAFADISRGHRKSASTNTTEKGSSNGDAEYQDFDAALVQLIIDGVSSPANRPVLQHWVDFVLMTVPQLQHRQDLLYSLCECFSEQLRFTMVKLRDGYAIASSRDFTLAITDAEPTMLMNVLERLLLLAAATLTRRSEDGGAKQPEGGSRLLGMMSGVFIADTSERAQTPRDDGASYIFDSVQALLVVWTVTEESSITGPTSTSRAQYFTKIRERARKVLEKLFKTQSAATVVSCIQVWASNSSDTSDTAVFDCIDTLTPSAQRVIEIVSESVNGRQSRLSSGETFTDQAFMTFLEAYILRLEAPIAVQIWSTVFGFARELLGSAGTPSAKAELYPLLRCLTTLARTVSTTSALEDRRLRRELQDTYAKVLDIVVATASRINDAPIWKRGSTDANHHQPNGSQVQDESKELYNYIAYAIIPSLRTFLVDQDRVNAACSSITQSIVMPAFRQQRVDVKILHILLEMTKIPSATKAWRLQVGDAFNDSRFFRMSPKISNLWRPLIGALMDSDKERFGELLSRITAAPSANIFTNREQEMISRSLNLRRLSFLLLAGERNHYLTQLPLIQEKLVEILRTNVVSPRVHSEVYLCLRVLMCRIGAQHLTNFWPVILAELLRVFESTMDAPPPDGHESLQLVLAACKFLDLLLVIQSEDFQIHQWMFVTDTTDAAYPPEDCYPEAIMDRLSEILSEHQHSTAAHPTLLSDDAVNENEESDGIRRPRLGGIKALQSLYQLQPFFARASIDTFEGVYANHGVDWEAVEDGLSGEIFEGS